MSRLLAMADASLSSPDRNSASTRARSSGVGLDFACETEEVSIIR